MISFFKGFGTFCILVIGLIWFLLIGWAYAMPIVAVALVLFVLYAIFWALLQLVKWVVAPLKNR